MNCITIRRKDREAGEFQVKVHTNVPREQRNRLARSLMKDPGSKTKHKRAHNKQLSSQEQNGYDTPSQARDHSSIHELNELSREFESSESRIRQQYPETYKFIEVLRIHHQKLLDDREKMRSQAVDQEQAIGSDWELITEDLRRLHPEEVEEWFQEDDRDFHQLIRLVLQLHESTDAKLKQTMTELDNAKSQREEYLQNAKKWERYHGEQIRILNGQHKTDLENQKAGLCREYDKRLSYKDTEIQQLRLTHNTELTQAQKIYEDMMQKQQQLREDDQRKFHNDLEQQRVKLESDITLLRQALLTTGDRHRPLLDSDIRARFNGLKNAVGILARKLLNEDGLEVATMSDRQRMTAKVEPKNHKFVVESIIWEILVEGFFSTPFRVFGSYGDSFAVTWSTLFRKYERLDPKFVWPEPDALCEKWRYTTCERFKRSLEQSSSHQIPIPQPSMSYVEHSSQMNDTLLGLCPQYISSERKSEVSSLVDGARTLALEFSVERCSLRMISLQPGNFISGSDQKMYTTVNPGVAEGQVEFLVSPGLRKIGDGRGGQLDKATDLCPADVFLRAKRN